MSTTLVRRTLALAAAAILAPPALPQHLVDGDAGGGVQLGVLVPVYPRSFERHFVGWRVRSTHVLRFDFLIRNNLSVPWYGGFVGEFLEHFGDLGALGGGGTPGCIWGLDGHPAFALQGPGMLAPGQVGEYSAFTQRVTVFPNGGCADLFGAPGEVYWWADQSALTTNAYAYVPALSVLNRSTLERRHEFTFDFRLPRLTPTGAPCASNRNSTGARGELDAYGSQAADDGLLVLVATAVPNGVVGYFLMSETARELPIFGGGMGDLCLGAPLLRLLSTVGTVAGFELAARLEFQTLPAGTRITPGSTWHFQFWHRDSNPGPTHNLTERLSLTFG